VVAWLDLNGVLDEWGEDCESVTLKSTCWPEPVRNHPGSGSWDPFAVEEGKLWYHRSLLLMCMCSVHRDHSCVDGGQSPPKEQGTGKIVGDNDYPLIRFY
jgi:hypothetical protein